MSLFRSLLVLGLVLTLTGIASAADEAKKAKKKDGVAGVVTDVAKDKDEGTITIKVHARKKDAAPAEADAEKKFKITKDTKFEKVTGDKGNREQKPATFADVQKGERVLIVPAADNKEVAKNVTLHGQAKKKANQ